VKIPFLDLKAQYASIKGEIDEAIQGILDRTEFVTGPTVRAFEEAFAAAHDLPFCASCNNGTSALHMLMWAHDIGPGDEVVTAANTFMATAGAICLTGAKPVLVDVEEQGYNMDPALLEAAITPRTKAILPVHLYGQPAEMDEIRAIADRHGLLLLEDCAQAHLASYKWRKVGGFGAGGAFSFYPGKNLGAYGEGGAVVTRDKTVYERICALRDHGMPEKYLHAEWGHNYRLEGLQGAVLRVKLGHLEAWTEARRRAAAWYREELAGLPGIVCPVEQPGRRHVYHLFVIRVTPDSGTTRDALMAGLQRAGIGCGLHYPRPCHLQPAAAELGYQAGDFLVTERLAGEILSLPMYAEITRGQVAEVAAAIRGAVPRA
jgi:dTDP-4-amino-4,6-dideoxygalactose transaminase